jgi:hypothetical protein
LANPLGSKKGNHTVAVFYWLLMKLPSLLRSSLKNAMLLGIVNASILKEREIEIFLQPFLKEIKLLEDGVEFNNRNETRIWHSVTEFCR